MDKAYFHNWAKEIAQKTGFILGEEIYRAEYYSSRKIRSMIFDGSYQSQPAVLKVYDDPRMTYQNLALKQFNAENKSKILLTPQGYELASIVWADWLMSADWRVDYSIWKQGIDEWMAEFEKIVPQLNLDDFPSLMRASLVERILGTILADICAAERSREEKEIRISLLYKLLDELLC